MLLLLWIVCRVLMRTTEVKSLAHFYHEFECFRLRSQPRDRVAPSGLDPRSGGIRAAGLRGPIGDLSVHLEKNAAFTVLIRAHVLDRLVLCPFYSLCLVALLC
jgi:hypothetical protein